MKSHFQSDESIEQIRKCLARSRGWVNAKEVAGMLGWPWRAAARALKYMSACGDIEERQIEVKSLRSRKRKRSIYRHISIAHYEAMPNWLIAKKIKASRPPTRIVRF